MKSLTILTEMKCHGCITYTSTFRGKEFILRLYKCAKDWMTSKVLTLTIYLTEMKCHGCITYTSTFGTNYMLRL